METKNVNLPEDTTSYYKNDEEENELDELDFMTELEKLRPLMEGKIINTEGDIVNVEIEEENEGKEENNGEVEEEYELDNLDFMAELEKLRPLMDGKIISLDGDIIDISNK
ncbi:unnamed protein product [Blepharisma stoltei]|uniref:Uncharacterized protein n=1 Tax=Blepharisma stoltei TaxID=1481888 RepID=A0AAU9ICF8_9CILI|nr:unnamed protein product [Blepharisma stoltei]